PRGNLADPPLDGDVLLRSRGGANLRREDLQQRGTHGGGARRLRRARRVEGAGQAAETGRDCDRGGGRTELDDPPAGDAATPRPPPAEPTVARALEGGRSDLLGEPGEVARERGACCAARDVRAQQRALDLRQLAVEPERRPCPGAFALHR